RSTTAGEARRNGLRDRAVRGNERSGNRAGGRGKSQRGGRGRAARCDRYVRRGGIERAARIINQPRGEAVAASANVVPGETVRRCGRFAQKCCAIVKLHLADRVPIGRRASREAYAG